MISASQLKIYSHSFKYHESHRPCDPLRLHLRSQRLDRRHPWHPWSCQQVHLQRHQIRTVPFSLFSIHKVIPTLTNKTAAAELTHDLNNPANQTMTGIDTTTWSQIRTAFGVPNPNCSKPGQTYISGSELSCLGILWKYFVPLNGCTWFIPQSHYLNQFNTIKFSSSLPPIFTHS